MAKASIYLASNKHLESVASLYHWVWPSYALDDTCQILQTMGIAECMLAVESAIVSIRLRSKDLVIIY